MWAYTPLSDGGAKKYGGRFNRPGTSALYTSLDPTTAWMEAQQGFPFKPQPMTLIPYQVDCADIVDLADPSIQNALDIYSSDLDCAWEYMTAQRIGPPTWDLADQLKSRNIAGILVRSFAPGCSENNRNLIFWEWSNSGPHQVQVIDDLNRLPKSSNSWPKPKSDSR